MRSSDDSSRPAGFTLGLNEDSLGMLGAAVLLLGAVFWSAHSPNVEKTDFSLTYVAAKIVHRGEGARLYDIGLQRQMRDSLFVHPNPLFYEHPPFEALVLSPLARLSFRTAYLLWGIMNASTWMLTMWNLRPHLARPREDLGYVSLWLLFAPLGIALYQGQTSLLLLALYSIAFVQLSRNREFTAGLSLGFGLIKLQFVLPFALVFLFRRRWRLAGGFAVTSAFLILLSLFAVGWQGIVNYVHFLSVIGRNPQNLSYGSAIDMPTLYGFVYAIAARRVQHLFLNAVVAFSSLLLVAVVAGAWRPDEDRSNYELMFAAAVAMSLVAGSHMFMHDFSPLLLAMLLALANLSRMDPKLAIVISATLILFWVFPIYFLLVAYHCLYLMCPVLLLFTFAMLAAARSFSKRRSEEQLAAV